MVPSGDRLCTVSPPIHSHTKSDSRARQPPTSPRIRRARASITVRFLEDTPLHISNRVSAITPPHAIGNVIDNAEKVRNGSKCPVVDAQRGTLSWHWIAGRVDHKTGVASSDGVECVCRAERDGGTAGADALLREAADVREGVGADGSRDALGLRR